MDPRTAKMLEERRAQRPASPRARALLTRGEVSAWLSLNWFRAAIAAAVLVLALSVGHYTMVTLPALKRDEIAAQKQAEQLRTLKFLANDRSAEACLADADSAYAE